MPEPGSTASGPLRLAVLDEIRDRGVEVAGEVWPTESMALTRLFERGAALLEAGGSLPGIAGSAPPDVLEALNVGRDDLLLVEALYLLTRHVTFVLTRDSQTMEQTWLRLADRHLAIRAEIVEQRRNEERLKRELKALGGSVVPLPEHEDLPMVDGDRPRKSRGMYEHLFAGSELVEVQIDPSPAALAAADRAAEERGWTREWGADARLLVLTFGISLALREREADAIECGDAGALGEAQAEVRGRLMGLEGRYSTLRRRLFELRHNNRILQWRITALDVEAAGMRARLDQFLVDRERLEQAIADRKAAGHQPAPEPTPPSEPEMPGGWRRRLGRLFGR
jgi:hypothetical protein